MTKWLAMFVFVNLAAQVVSTTQKMSDSQIDCILLKELECPVCFEYIASPIKMCENGHNVCNSCMLRISACPTCKGQFIDVRNITVEKNAAIAIYSCKNRKLDVKRHSQFTAEINISSFVCTRAKNVHSENCQMSTASGLVLCQT